MREEIFTMAKVLVQDEYLAKQLADNIAERIAAAERERIATMIEQAVQPKEAADRFCHLIRTQL